MSKIDKTREEKLPELKSKNIHKSGKEYPEVESEKQLKIDQLKKYFDSKEDKTKEGIEIEEELGRDNITTERVNELFQQYVSGD